MKGILQWLIDAGATARAVAVILAAVLSALGGVTVDGVLTGGDVAASVAGARNASSCK